MCRLLGSSTQTSLRADFSFDGLSTYGLQGKKVNRMARKVRSRFWLPASKEDSDCGLPTHTSHTYTHSHAHTQAHFFAACLRRSNCYSYSRHPGHRLNGGARRRRRRGVRGQCQTWGRSPWSSSFSLKRPWPWPTGRRLQGRSPCQSRRPPSRGADDPPRACPGGALPCPLLQSGPPAWPCPPRTGRPKSCLQTTPSFA